MSKLILNETKFYRERNLIRVALVISVFLGSIAMIQANTTECGTVSLQRGLIIGGDAVLRDEWPFIAALYYSKPFKYFCGGTIISNKHVLTAAHCIHGKFSNARLLSDEITVRLGAYNLTASSESGVVDRSVTQIHIHPDWNVRDKRYDADIAVLVLNENVTFSINIRPVCLPADGINIEGSKGMVVGWGITENGTAEGIPRQTETTALNDSYCYRQDSVIASYSSQRSFCGVGKGAPNKGDSGDGFFVVTGSSWVQYGTVSIVRTNATGHVIPGVFAAFTKLTSLKHWIADTVKQSGSLVSEATLEINLQCIYKYDDDGRLYSCWLFDLNIRKSNFVVKSFTGFHELHKENCDVELIVFESGVMFFLPDNIGDIFKNLKYLTVGKQNSVSIGTKRIQRSNFQSLELEHIRFLNNEIEELDENSLSDLSELQSFHIEKGKLKFLNAATFSKNFKLTTVHVLSNVLTMLPRNIFENNLLLASVAFDGNLIEALDDGTFDQNVNLKNVSFQRNCLECLNNNLFRNNSELVFVDFSNNALKTIGEQTFQTNSKLKILSLESNRLEYLPSEILRDKPFLERINFSNNSLKSIDERLFETNSNVREIHLQTNQLETLPSNLFHKNFLLRVVNLGKNSFKAIDEKLFEKNVLLRNVSLKSNRLNELPSHLLKNNLDLEYVNVANNHLIVMDERIFQMNSNLQNVDLSSNLLASLPTNLFRNNSLLQIVDLSKNRIESIDENIFTANLRLERIFLGVNHLQSLPRNLFRLNANLEHIDLSRNSLKIVEVIFSLFNRVVYISLSNNACIDAVFDKAESRRFHRRIRNLIEFQDRIDANCNSHAFIVKE